MIIEAILNPIFALILKLLNFIPDGFTVPDWGNGAIALINNFLMFFPDGVFGIVVGNITFWLGVHAGWIVIEWVYKKIPGIS